MRGSVKRDKSGWYFIVDRGPDPVTNKRRQVRRRGFATKKEAEFALAKFVHSQNSGQFVDLTKITVEEYLIGRWLPAVEHRIRRTTIDSYRRSVHRHIVPALGPTRLQSLDEAAVDKWLTQLTEAGLAPKTVRNIHAVFSKALNDAVRLRLLQRNPASRAQLPPLPAIVDRSWTPGEVAVFLEATKNDQWSTMWRILAVTGMRRGEVLGLRWPDVDLVESTLRVVWQRTMVNGAIYEGPPKTGSGNRTVTLDAKTVAALRSQRARQNADRLRMGEVWLDDSEHVFTWPNGHPLSPKTVTAWFKKWALALGLRPIGVHGLRHSAASAMISAGESPKLVSQRLGHANVVTTLQRYTHVQPAHDREAAERLAASFELRPGEETAL